MLAAAFFLGYEPRLFLLHLFHAIKWPIVVWGFWRYTALTVMPKSMKVGKRVDSEKIWKALSVLRWTRLPTETFHIHHDCDISPWSCVTVRRYSNQKRDYWNLSKGIFYVQTTKKCQGGNHKAGREKASLKANATFYHPIISDQTTNRWEKLSWNPKSLKSK